MQDALDLMPEIVGDESVGVKYAINGLFSLTPDGMPILGETPEVKGLWSAAAVWVKEGPGVGKSLAEWMVLGESHIDLHSSDVSRFHAHQKTRAHVRARTGEAFPKTYGIIHPAEQWASDRNLRISPMHEQEQALGAVFYEVAGWERPQWYESNAPLVEQYGVEPREAEWDARWWSPIINAEHLAMREHAGIFDLSAFAIFDVQGPGALDALQRSVLAQMDVAVGRVVYTPVLGQGGGFKSDLTIMRLGDESFRIVTGGAHGMADKQAVLRPAARRRVGNPRRRHDRVDDDRALGPARAGHPLERHLATTFRTRGSPSARAARSRSARSSCSRRASRTSAISDGSSTCRSSRARRLWDILWEAGAPHGLTPCGIGVYGTTGRLEKCYRAFAAELESEYTVVEAGMSRPKVKEQDFVGKEAHLRHREEEPAAILCTLTVDDHASGNGVRALSRSGASRSRCATERRSPTRRGAARTSRAPARARRSASTS